MFARRAKIILSKFSWNQLYFFDDKLLSALFARRLTCRGTFFTPWKTSLREGVAISKGVYMGKNKGNLPATETSYGPVLE